MATVQRVVPPLITQGDYPHPWVGDQFYGPNLLRARQETTAWRAFLAQFKNPLVLILVFAAVTSAFLHEWVDATVVLSL